MTRTDASLSAYMNDLRRQRNRRVGSVEASGVLTVRPATTVLAGVLRLRGCQERGRPAKGIKKEERVLPGRPRADLANGRHGGGGSFASGADGGG
ncbi:hypothetical protein ACSQ67_009975 [Phaseolus vulgaris]